MLIYVKNMFNQRAISNLIEEMDRLHIKYKSIELGEITFEDDITLQEIYNLDLSIHKYRLSLILLNSKIVTDIRNIILDLARQNVCPETNISDSLTRKLGYNYAYLDMYFAIETGLSIEKYYHEKSAEKISYCHPQYSS
jgi:hypothetical protein